MLTKSIIKAQNIVMEYLKNLIWFFIQMDVILKLLFLVIFLLLLLFFIYKVSSYGAAIQYIFQNCRLLFVLSLCLYGLIVDWFDFFINSGKRLFFYVTIGTVVFINSEYI